MPNAYNLARQIEFYRLFAKGINMNPYQLSDEQKAFYHENGYLIGLPAIYTPEEMRQINAEQVKTFRVLG